MKRILSTIAILMMTVLLTGCPYSPQQETVQRMINVSRSNHNVRTLPLNYTNSLKAQRWSNHLADCHCLEHSNLADNVQAGWWALGENVGYVVDGNLARMHRLFLQSPAHRQNILNGRWTVLGTGVTVRGHRIYVVHVFGDYTR